MSHVRFGQDGSAVYVYPHAAGHLECCGCLLSATCFGTRDTERMVAHLEEHIAAGHTVPDYVIPALREDAARNLALEDRTP